MAKCPNCGEKIVEKKLNFCGFCGANLKTGEKSLANELENISKSKSAKMRDNNTYNEPVSYNPPPAPKIEPAPVNQVRYKSSIVGAGTGMAEQPDITETAVPMTSGGFTTGEISAIPETNILIEEDADVMEAPVITEIGEINTADEIAEPAPAEEVYEQESENKEDVLDDEAAGIVNDMEAAFANLGHKTVSYPQVQEETVDTENAESVQEAVQIPEETPVIAEDTANEEIKMVSCVGIDVKTAEFMLSKAGIKYEVVTRNSDAVRGEVIEQSCTAGEIISSDTIVKIVASCGTWSEWSETEPDGTVNEVESVTMYRTRTREKTIDHKTSVTSDIMNGYNLVNVEKGYGDWAVEDYFTTESRKPSESSEISENLTGFKYCGWFYKGTSAIERNSCCSLEMALYFNNDTKEADWEYREVISFNNIRETVVAWTPIYEAETSETPAGDKVKPNIHMITYKVDGTDYPLKYGSFETQWYKYKSRTINDTTYHFEREVYTDWSEWSEWSEDAQVATEFMEVETKVLYRYRTVADEK